VLLWSLILRSWSATAIESDRGHDLSYSIFADFVGWQPTRSLTVCRAMHKTFVGIEVHLLHKGMTSADVLFSSHEFPPPPDACQNAVTACLWSSLSPHPSVSMLAAGFFRPHMITLWLWLCQMCKTVTTVSSYTIQWAVDLSCVGRFSGGLSSSVLRVELSTETSSIHYYIVDQIWYIRIGDFTSVISNRAHIVRIKVEDAGS